MRASLLLVCCGCVGFHSAAKLDHALAFGPIDLVVQRVYFPDETPPNGVVLEYRFGNRTGRGVPVDLRDIRVEIDGRDALPYDPRGEIQAERLGPEGVGEERIIYLTETGEPPHRVCVRLNGACTEVGP